MLKSKTLTVRVAPHKHTQYTKAANNIGLNLSRYVIKLLEDDISAGNPL